MEKIKCSTPDFAKENAKKLLALFPECEGQKGEMDIDKLRQVLSSTAIEGDVERYQFTWPGKRNAMAATSAEHIQFLILKDTYSSDIFTKNQMFLPVHMSPIRDDGSRFRSTSTSI